MVTEQGVSVQALDHCVLPVMDLWRSERFYTEALGGSIFQKVGLTFDEVSTQRGAAPPGAFIKLGVNHIGLFLQNKTPVCPPAVLDAAAPCFGFGVRGDLAEVGNRITAAGGSVGKIFTQSFRGVARPALRAVDSEGNCIELVQVDSSAKGEPEITGITHLHFESTDIPATVHFYEQFIGAELLDESGEQSVLGLASGQQLFFHRVNQLSPSMVGPFRGRHFAFHVTDDMFHAIVDKLRREGIPEGDVRGAEPGGKPWVAPRVGDELGTYVNDPDGLRLQLINEDSAHALGSNPRMRYSMV